MAKVGGIVVASLGVVVYCHGTAPTPEWNHWVGCLAVMVGTWMYFEMSRPDYFGEEVDR